jgi:DNA-binding Lrp family transcriptional regulator
MTFQDTFSIDLINLLSSDQGVYNRQIAKSIGLGEAVFFAEIVYKYKYFIEKGECEEINGEFYFYTTYESIFEKTGLTKDQCMRIVPNLVNHGLIKTIDKGIPKKKYYTLNLEEIYKKVYYKSGKSTSRSRESPLQEIGKVHFSSYIYNELKETKSLENFSQQKNAEASTPQLSKNSINVYESGKPTSRVENRRRERKTDDIPDTKAPDAKSTYQKEISLENEEEEQISDPLDMFDVPIDKKYDVTDKYSKEQIVQALAITDAKCSTDNKKARWRYFLKVLESPPKKTKSPFDEVSQAFENQKKYNDATCFLNKDAIAFQRGMKHMEIKFKFFDWKAFEEMCSEFGINFRREK